MDAVERWFGSGFDSLHLLLQKLHRDGGTLGGTVSVDYGSGLAGWLGRRMAAGFGIPRGATSVALAVEIRTNAERLHWNRVFAGTARVNSVFVPQGRWPDGHWVEQTGLLKLALRVDTSGGGWQWRPVGCSIAGVPLPVALMPRVDAGKCIEDGRYRFHVRVSLPLLGFLFAYSGVLTPEDAPSPLP